jgi:hypothetical protein
MEVERHVREEAVADRVRSGGIDLVLGHGACLLSEGSRPVGTYDGTCF